MTDEIAIEAETLVDDWIAEYRSHAEPLGVRVERATGQDAAALIREAAGEAATDRVVVTGTLQQTAPQLLADLTATGLKVVQAGPPATIKDAPLGVSLARLAVAETGSVLLAEPTLEDRAVGVVTLSHVTICPLTALVATLEEAVPVLREVAHRPGGGYAMFVTGPSRTADIELTLTVGVQGPGRVLVVFVDELA